MSCREVEGEGPLDSGNVSNVVPLQPVGSTGVRGSAAAAQEAAALDAAPFAPDAITRDGLDLLKAFFAIDDASARAALVLLAQRLAQSTKK